MSSYQNILDQIEQKSKILKELIKSNSFAIDIEVKLEKNLKNCLEFLSKIENNLKMN